jgi:hypothetical protein
MSYRVLGGDCVADCPILKLDLQSEGGASRYFYAFGDEDELKNYLISMIKCDNV